MSPVSKLSKTAKGWGSFAIWGMKSETVGGGVLLLNNFPVFWGLQTAYSATLLRLKVQTMSAKEGYTNRLEDQKLHEPKNEPRGLSTVACWGAVQPPEWHYLSLNQQHQNTVLLTITNDCEKTRYGKTTTGGEKCHWNVQSVDKMCEGMQTQMQQVPKTQWVKCTSTTIT